jgi:sporulation protein YlmC with PRC-barrel domain
MKVTITRSYDSASDAYKAASAAKASGIADDDVSVIANNTENWYSDDKGSDAADGAAKGATVGAVAGGTAGLLAGLGMLAIPGLGPIVAAGWLAAMATGAVAGAAAGGATGGLIGAMTNHDVSEEDAHVYAENVRRGGTLLMVRADESRRAAVENILDGHNPVNVEARRTMYRSGGWDRFDEKAKPYTAHEIARERGSYATSGNGTAGPSIAVDRVEGTEVYNARGDHLGEVDDVIIDKTSGKVAYAVMSFGGVLGIGEKYHPVPWSMLKYDMEKGGYVVPIDKATLENAPSYEASDLNFKDRAWNTRVYDYYKVPPYWG